MSGLVDPEQAIFLGCHILQIGHIDFL